MYGIVMYSNDDDIAGCNYNLKMLIKVYADYLSSKTCMYNVCGVCLHELYLMLTLNMRRPFFEVIRLTCSFAESASSSMVFEIVKFIVCLGQHFSGAFSIA